MKPIDICKNLGPEKVDAYYGELSGKEIRAVLKAGGSHSNTPSTAFSQAARRKVWRKRFDAEFAKENEQLALALLIEWLMRHHRNMLVEYLDHLGVKHTQGETDEDFCETKTPEQLREGATMLLGKYPPHEVGTYLLLADTTNHDFDLPAGLEAHWQSGKKRIDVQFVGHDQAAGSDIDYVLWTRAFRTLAAMLDAHGVAWQAQAREPVTFDRAQQMMIETAGETGHPDGLTVHRHPDLGLV
ncbi:MAG: hypothetical protein R6X02_09735, partial [Enhygromyxa sp.]